MNKLFNGDNSDSETELQVNTNYAHSYNSWRQKEELNKLKTKYGEHIQDLNISGEDSSSSEEEEDDEGGALTEDFEKNFYKTLACLKNKDPRIYDEKVTFFDDTMEARQKTDKKTKEKPLYIRDYERKVMIERNGKFSDSENEDEATVEHGSSGTLTYVEEQRRLKESFKNIADDDEDDTLLKPKSKTDAEKRKEDEAYKEWLKGQVTEIAAEEQTELKPLRDFWTDPKLDPKEKFLRDYILNKKFLDEDTGDFSGEYELAAHDSDENLTEDERNIETQEEFEHKYNFRFEEPDQEFIKRYPRTMENSLRRKDTRRAEKRAALKKRKEEESLKKREELKQLKAMKRKEIEEKIEKLKEITGNNDIHLSEIDLEGDFDPLEHDRKMQAMFNEEFYAEPESDQKPVFPDIDEELEIENTWDKYDPNEEEIVPENMENAGPHCDDPDFNMDADFDPSKTLQQEMIESSKKKKKRKRSKLAAAVAKKKPKFDPATNPSYQTYLDQYYALDYEDMIGDLPCRFKYRNVVPNDYGLTVDEILMADDKELNKWCSLKKALQHRPEYLELNDVRSYRQKAQNLELKKKIFQSIYGPREESENQEHRAVTSEQRPQEQETQEPPKKKRKRNKKKNSAAPSANTNSPNLEATKAENSSSTGNSTKQSDENNKTGSSSPKKLKTKKLVGNETNSTNVTNSLETVANDIVDAARPLGNKMKNKRNAETETESNISPKKSSLVEKQKVPGIQQKRKKKGVKEDKAMDKKNKMKHNKVSKNKKDLVTDLSTERLKAYGINPKKFKNKLKYGSKK